LHVIETSLWLSENNNMKKIISICFTLLMAASAQAGLLFNYSQLALKDLDQMNKLIQSKIQESRKAGGDKVIPLKEALQAVFSRSNEDFMIEKLLPPLKTELDEHNAWEKAIEALVKESMGALKNPRAFKPVVQVTYIIFLENLIAELKPKLSEEFEHKIIKRIADAHITITKEAANERRLRVMKGSTSPSLLAEAVLKEYQEQQENKKAEPEVAPSNEPQKPEEVNK
jgi:hypothetical protein